MTPLLPRQPASPITPERMYQFLVMLWVVLFATTGVYYFLTTILKPGKTDADSPLAFPVLGLAIFMILASIYARMRFGVRDNQPRSLPMVKAGYIISLVFAEVPALLGLVLYVLSAWPDCWVFFLISAAGFILNFPRRNDFERAARIP